MRSTRERSAYGSTMGEGPHCQSYGLTRDSLTAFPEEHLEFIRQVELYYQTKHYFLVHAGAPAGQTLARSVEDPEARHTFLWGRNHINAPETPWEKTVIFGHTPRAELIRRPNMIGIDTGCVFASPGMGNLTALVLPQEEVVQQKRLD